MRVPELVPAVRIQFSPPDNLELYRFSDDSSETAACVSLSRGLKDTGESAHPATQGWKAESHSGPAYLGVLRTLGCRLNAHDSLSL